MGGSKWGCPCGAILCAEVLLCVACHSVQDELLVLKRDCCGEGLTAANVSAITQDELNKVG